MLIKNIGILAGIVPEGVLRKEGASQGIVDCLENAWLLTEDGRTFDLKYEDVEKVGGQ